MEEIPDIKILQAYGRRYSIVTLKRSNILHFPKQLYFGNFKWEDSIVGWGNKWEIHFEQDKFSCVEPDMFDIKSLYVFSCFIEMLQETYFEEVIIWNTVSLKDQLYLIWVLAILNKLLIIMQNQVDL